MSKSHLLELSDRDSMISREVEDFLEEMDRWDNIDTSQQDTTSTATSACEMTPFVVLFNRIQLEDELGINNFGSRFALDLVTTPTIPSDILSKTPRRYAIPDPGVLLQACHEQPYSWPQEIIAPVVPSQATGIKLLSPSPYTTEISPQLWGSSSAMDYITFKQSPYYMPSPLYETPFAMLNGVHTLDLPWTPLYSHDIYNIDDLEFKTTFKENLYASQLPSPHCNDTTSMFSVIPLENEATSILAPTLQSLSDSPVSESIKLRKLAFRSSTRKFAAAEGSSKSVTSKRLAQRPKRFYILEPYQYSDDKVDRRSFNSRKELKQAQAQAQAIGSRDPI
ncbi:hypothetical protein BGZ76_002896 [Entomortierella beljakovae]|nr:hypothetical protein BGZ76_002896 [Entomortierella beljakovae]